MLKDQVISVTDLRVRTKECLEDLDRTPKFVIMNSKMVAVLLGPEEYETLIRPDLVELPVHAVTSTMRGKARQAKRTPKEKLLDL